MHTSTYFHTYTCISNKWSELKVTGQGAVKDMEKQRPWHIRDCPPSEEKRRGSQKASGLTVLSCHQGTMLTLLKTGRGQGHWVIRGSCQLCAAFQNVAIGEWKKLGSEQPGL